MANPAKQVAERELLWNASQIPAELPLFSYADANDEMILPLGFRHALERGLRAAEIEVLWEDRREHQEGDAFSHVPPIQLRDYQEPMCEALISGECGIVEAPTAAGKTASTLEAIRRIGQRRTLVVVDKASLAHQWQNRAREFLGIETGYIGEGEMCIEALTIALRQSLWARRDELYEANFFDLFGCVVIDEVHHIQAPTLVDLIQRFPARYRWGVSATPDRDPLMFPLVQAVIGPIVWETTMQDAAEHLVIPSVRVLESSFEFDYHPTQRLIDEQTGKSFVLRNNYGSMMSALCADEDRNAMIAKEIAWEVAEDHHVLVLSRRKGHLRALSEALSAVLPGLVPFFLTGEDSGERAGEVAQAIDSAPTGIVLFSTIAEEGLDVVRLDRVVLAYPGRNPEVYRQQIGRVMRPAVDKTDAIVIDIRDGRQGLLASQFRDRAQALYGREGWRIERLQAAQ